MIIAYFIIGLIIGIYSLVGQAVDDKEEFKSDCRKLTYWIGWVVCTIFWPVIIAWAIYKAIHILSSVQAEDDSV